jgi:hypothetical protein
MHAAAQAFHRGATVADSLGVIGDMVTKFPAADVRDACGLFLKYAADERNSKAKVVLCEEPIKFEIAPAPEDITKQPIVVVGTLDQVRELEGGKLKLYDIKTSKKPGGHLMRQHTIQIAAYCVGASIKLGKRVDPGALILPRKYGTNDPQFVHFPWTLSDTEHILRGLRHVVAAIRSGNVYHVPGETCEWCPARSPDLCLPRLVELRKQWQTA